MSKTGPSGWCSPCTSPRSHAKCQARLDDPKIELECTCPGHPPKGDNPGTMTPPKRGYW